MKIEEHEKTIETINAIINNGKIAEVKIENGKKLVVVEINRSIRSVEEKDETLLRKDANLHR